MKKLFRRSFALWALPFLPLHGHLPDPTPLSTDVVLVGDTGRDTRSQADVAMAMARVCAEEACDLGMLAGDNVYPAGVSSEDDRVMERMFDKHYNRLGLPFLVALGNHDYGTLYNRWDRGEFQRRHSTRNPLFVLPHFWHVRETAQAVFAIVDTSRMMWKNSLEPQARMVREAHALARASGKWLVVLGHHPYLSNGDHGNAGNYEGASFPDFVSGKHVKAFFRDHVCGKADFYLAGHDHGLQVLEGGQAGCDTLLVVSGGGSEAEPLRPRNRALFGAGKLGFFHLSFTAEQARVRAFDETAAPLYEGVFTKR